MLPPSSLLLSFPSPFSPPLPFHASFWIRSEARIHLGSIRTNGSLIGNGPRFSSARAAKSWLLSAITTADAIVTFGASPLVLYHLTLATVIPDYKSLGPLVVVPHILSLPTEHLPLYLLYSTFLRVLGTWHTQRWQLDSPARLRTIPLIQTTVSARECARHATDVD
jgi:hypothetical protein